MLDEELSDERDELLDDDASLFGEFDWDWDWGWGCGAGGAGGGALSCCDWSAACCCAAALLACWLAAAASVLLSTSDEKSGVSVFEDPELAHLACAAAASDAVTAASDVTLYTGGLMRMNSG